MAPSTPRPPWIWGNVAFIALSPVLAVVLCAWYLPRHGITWQEILATILLWWLTGLGITAGYHRLFAHRGWSAPVSVRFLALLFGGMAAQNSAIAWCAAHRYHHRDVDTPADPYNIHQGFWHAHVLWVLIRGAHHDDFDSVPDLKKDPLCALQHRYYLLVVAGLNLLIPLGLGLLTGRVMGMLLFAGLVRMVLVHHFTFFINSLAHMWGSRSWTTSVTARDNWVLSFFTFGEGYHNFHHAFQADYRNGVKWFHWDPTKWFIFTLSTLGLAHDLRRTPVDVLMRRRYEQKRAELQARLDGWSEAARERFNQAEQRMDAALAQLQAARLEFSVRQEERKAHARRELARAVGEARRAVKEAQRLVAAEMQRFEEGAILSAGAV